MAVRSYFYFCGILFFIAADFIFAFSWQRDSAYLNIRLNDDTTSQIQNEEQIVMNPKDTTNMVAVWRDFRLGYRQVAYAYTFDGGLTWEQALFEEPQYIWDSDPGLTVDTAGNFYAVILSFNSTSEPNGLFVYKSTDGGVSWSGPVTVINGVAGVFEDKELIACDRSGGPYTNNLYVAWTRFYTTQILLCRSTDGGNSFVGPVTVSDNTGVQWPVPAVGPNSELYVAWLDYSPGALKLDLSTDGGQTFGSDRVIQNVSFVQGYINGSITVFSFPAMDVDITGGPNNGNIYVAYMDYSSGYTDTDIYFTRSTDGGNTWSTKVRINDDPQNNGCDQFHPWLTITPDGDIVVVFLDRRLDPQNLLMDLYLTTSTDGGLTWSANERITTVSSDPTAGFRSLPRDISAEDQPLILAQRAGLIGEYIGVTASSLEDIHPIWTDTRLGDQDAFVGVKDTAAQYAEEYQRTHLESSVLSILPNPSSGNITIKIQGYDGHHPKTNHLRIFDISGRLIKTYSDVGSTVVWNRYTDDGEFARSGVYFCSLMVDGTVITRKFLLF
ncbi:MAG TPA: T9SS type A sorting domain-containing protein [candidate division WOR-3 bacterium]|uniref:T9SS type A sorting domain-containing protein n=1 Tax=candidate division WOR-3 bacterium TaxID=2052148 RepID=A0A9C9ELB6_UNCW3|nr:T9SS type A sorting domain-containing protein [candidate division WOR-3 bacterium]